MSSKKQIILAFDAYGTLLSTESIAKQLSSHFGQEKAGSIAAEWRKYQLEYTWRLNSMGTVLPRHLISPRINLHLPSWNIISLPT